MLRGKDAFHVKDCGSHLDITAELVRGAQLGRKDGLVFKRKVILHSSPTIHYWVSLEVGRSWCQAQELCKVRIRYDLIGSLGGVEVSVRAGVLHVCIPTKDEDRWNWIPSRNGTTYVLVDFTLPKDFRLEGGGYRAYDGNLCVSRWDAEGAALVPTWVLEPRRRMKSPTTITKP